MNPTKKKLTLQRQQDWINKEKQEGQVKANMSENTIRNIQMMKGGTFTVQFMIRFDKEWGEATRTLKKSRKDLKNIPIVRR